MSTSVEDFSLIAWVHLYMLGFVMMAIFAAMAQLGPIVIEADHHNVNIFKYLWLILLTGLMLMLFGFYQTISFLFYGGLLVLLAMGLYAIEFLLTLRKSCRTTSITHVMKLSTIFLLIGILSGLFMAASFNAYINITLEDFLHIHAFGLLVGFVILLIMGVSTIIIPMFGSSARISDKEFTKSLYAIVFGVSLMILSAFFYTTLLKNFAYFVTIVSLLLYFSQVYKMTSSRKRIIHDVWARSMYVAFISFFVAFLILCVYLFSNSELLLKVGMWLLFVGFFGFIIIGNFYKIIPFLVWFHIYAPLLEERAVPMLHELLPQRLANLQWFFSLSGLILSTLSLILQNDDLFIGALVLLSVGAALFLFCIHTVLKIKV